jgi:hypothetical protein
MNNTAILNVRLRTDFYRGFVSPYNGMGPDTAILMNRDAAYDNRTRMHIATFMDLGCHRESIRDPLYEIYYGCSRPDILAKSINIVSDYYDLMRTYLAVMFNTEGGRPSAVVERLQMIGFKPTTGNYDFVYEWDKNATVEDTIYIADKIHDTLKGMGAQFRLETEILSDSE